ncbi:universal stress protein [Pseudomonas citronellolis]|uniref:universal stress protein n=1 Tax=Pseudomonas citronellolis TaxID=53408 RepID=UPI002D7892BB|nr:universal stress protein [Pseudomonas citronellolis]WRT82061.1 universal stress protein [Pseudomonas citronellolis]
MNAYTRLLLICDPLLRDSAAMARAKALALAGGGQLHMVTLDALPVGLGVLDSVLQTRAREETRLRQERWLEERAGELRAQGVEVGVEAIWTENPLEEALRLVEQHGIDLVVKDSQYEPALSRAIMTPLDWQLLRRCPVPLHLVSTADNPRPQRVLAALDLSQDDVLVDQLNDHIVESAQALARQCGAELHLLQAYDLASGYLAYAAGPVAWSPEVAEQMSGRSRQRMDRIGERFGVGRPYQHLVKGAATQVISEFANEKRFDVVVMGTLYRPGLAKIIGSTTEQALYRVHSGILAVRP